MDVSGFTTVRNAERLHYPLFESVCSAVPLCDEFIINVGDSEDRTLEFCDQLQAEFPEKIRIIQNKWDTKNQSGGKQLSYQTNLALERCQGDWCFYLQADEVIHDKEIEKLRHAMKIADLREDIDGLVFDYLHFYGNYDYLIRGRNWYRKEVRLFKNYRDITSYKDAQGFRRDGRRLLAIDSNARIFHYGYVRPPESMKIKSQEMSRWWGSKPENNIEKLKPVRHIGLKRFYESHPSVMHDRIAQENTDFQPSRHKRRWDWTEFKNAMTLIWEKVFPRRIGEYRNYDLIKVGKLARSS